MGRFIDAARLALSSGEAESGAVTEGFGTGLDQLSDLMVPGDTSTEEVLEVGGYQTSTLELADDSDWYQLDLTEGEAVRVTLVGVNWNPVNLRAALEDGALTLRDSDGNVVETGVEVSYDVYEGLTLTYLPETTGTFYVDVSGATSEAVGDYVVVANSVDPRSPGYPRDEVEDTPIAGDTSTTATLEVGTFKEETIDFAGDTDWFAIEMTAGQAVRFSSVGYDHTLENIDFRLFDADLTIYDASGNEVASNDDFDPQLNFASLIYTAEETATYYVEVSGGEGPFGYGESGEYLLSANRAVSTAIDAIGDFDFDFDGFDFEGFDFDGFDFDFDFDFEGFGGTTTASMASAQLLSVGETSEADGATAALVATTLNLGNTSDLLVPGDATTNADLNLPGIEFSSIEIPADVDWYRVELTEGDTIRISLAQVDWNPINRQTALTGARVSLLDEDGNAVAVGETYEIFAVEDLDAKTLVYTVETSGSYFVQVSGTSLFDTGDYALTANTVQSFSPAFPAPGEEEDRAPSDATTNRSIEMDSRRYETVDFAGDTDWYSFEATAGDAVRFSVLGVNHDSDNVARRLSDAEVRIYDADGNEIAFGDDVLQGRGLASTVFFPTESGTYYVEVSGDDATTGDYILDARDVFDVGRAAVEEVRDYLGPDDKTTDKELEVGGVEVGAIVTSSDTDWYKLELDAGETVRVTLGLYDWNPISLRGALFGGELNLRDEDGNLIDTGFTLGVETEYGATLVVTAETDSTYFVEVAGETGINTGDYIVVANEVRPLSPAFPTPEEEARPIPGDSSTNKTVAPGARRYETVDFEGDTDWFRVELELGQEVRFSVLGFNHTYGNGYRGLKESEIRVFDAEGNEVALGDDISNGRGLSSLNFVATETSEYYVEVSGADEFMMGDYVLDVADPNDGVLPILPLESPGVAAGLALAAVAAAGTSSTVAPTSTTPTTLVTTPGDETTEEVLEVNGYQAATLQFPSDTDWYQMSLDEGDVVRVTLVGADWNPANLRTALENGSLALRDADGNVVASGEDIAFEVTEVIDGVTLVYEVETAGTYFVDVSGESVMDIGDYVVVANTVTRLSPFFPDDGVEANPIAGDTSTTASIETGAIVQDTIDFDGDADWFAIDMSAGEEVRFTALGFDHNEENEDLRLWDPELKVFDDDGVELAANSDFDEALNFASLVFDAAEDGTYYVEVTGAAGEFGFGGTGDYALAANRAVADGLAGLLDRDGDLRPGIFPLDDGFL
ncbi:MAG: PPC domain-containing protein [Pseudomonadota bacterium]